MIESKIKDFCKKYPVFYKYFYENGNFPRLHLGNKAKKIKVFHWGKFVYESNTILDIALLTSHTPTTVSDYVRNGKRTQKGYSFEYSDPNILIIVNNHRNMMEEYSKLFKEEKPAKKEKTIIPPIKKVVQKIKKEEVIFKKKEIAKEEIFYSNKTGLAYYFNGIKNNKVQAKKTLYTNHTYTYEEIQTM